ncbi:hypothetical protein P5673_006703 [Acropora cervicornis]|uniref:Endonuclease/exonuclease/phosphatase domain-containing protein n=1 Tax=Acropora cervicornis TaxID=6130 RepID=A0AAD9QWE1_ACRCE|nr:hypothetical protein P5673_006703 [Acropora cervicornis]
MSADQTPAAGKNNVMEENSNSSPAFLPSMRGFKLASLNIASLPKHIDELRVLLSDNPLDILFVNETRLDDSVSDDGVYIPGYDVIRRDREHNGRFGGGVCIYVPSNINFSLRPDLSDVHLENLCIEIRKPRSKPFIIATRYRPPNSSTEIFSHFESFVGKLDAENVKYNIVDIYNLYQLIDTPTRITNTSSTLIDVIFTNCQNNIVSTGVSHVSLSDHSLYAFRKISINSPKGHSTLTYRKFNNFDSARFRYDISTQDWD